MMRATGASCAGAGRARPLSSTFRGRPNGSTRSPKSLARRDGRSSGDRMSWIRSWPRGPPRTSARPTCCSGIPRRDAVLPRARRCRDRRRRFSPRPAPTTSSSRSPRRSPSWLDRTSGPSSFRRRRRSMRASCSGWRRLPISRPRSKTCSGHPNAWPRQGGRPRHSTDFTRAAPPGPSPPSRRAGRRRVSECLLRPILAVTTEQEVQL